MQIIKDYPPNIDAIDAAFKVKDKVIFYAYGDKIFNPKGHDVHPSIIDHETVHSIRQAGDPEDWWKRYIDDPVFRLQEEVPAHRAELKWFMDREEFRNQKIIGWRGGEEFYLTQVAKKLLNPIYNFNLSLVRAKALVA